MIKSRFHLLAALPLLASCGPEREAAAPPVATDARPTDAPAAPAPAAAASGIAPLTAEGWGPLRIGMTLEQLVAAVGPDSDPAAIGGPEPEACDIFHPARAPEGLRVMIEEGRLTRVSISAPTAVKTDRGLGPGDAAATVRAAYPDGLRASPHEYVEAPAQYLTFWTVGGGDEAYVRSAAARGVRFEVDQGGRVAIIHVGGPSIQYVEGCA